MNGGEKNVLPEIRTSDINGQPRSPPSTRVKKSPFKSISKKVAPSQVGKERRERITEELKQEEEENLNKIEFYDEDEEEEGPNRKKKIEEVINKIELNKIREIFENADVDGDRTLNEEEFIKSFGSLLGSDNEEELRIMFARIDANANGEIDWDEFSTFLLLGSEGQRKMKEDLNSKEFVYQPIQNNNHFSWLHKDMIIKIVHDAKGKKYFSSSRDGTVRAWNSSNLMYHNLVHSSSKWITDILYIPDHNELAVCGVDRTFYDCDTYELTRSYKGKKISITGKREVVTQMPAKGRIKLPLIKKEDVTKKAIKKMRSGMFKDFYRKPKQIEMIVMEDMIDAPMSLAYFPSGREYLLVGMDRGFVQMYDITKKGHKLSREKVDVIKQAKKWQPHSDWVTKMIVAEELMSLITCSTDKKIQILNLEKNVPLRTLRGHERAIFDMDWYKPAKLIVSCGLERDILIWNAFIPNYLCKLSGHQAPVTNVCFNPRDYQLISLSQDKVIKIWDIRNYKCIQTIREKKTFSPEDRMTACKYDPVNNVIVAGSNQLHTYHMKRNFSEFKVEYKGHRKPLVAVLYNDKYKQCVSLDEHTVCTWDVMTGKLQFKFDIESMIINACFDKEGRRLLVSTADGNISIWNYINGQLLKKCEGIKDMELTSMAYVPRDQNTNSILAGGWNRRLVVWDDSEDEFLLPVSRRMEFVPVDILAIAFCPPNFVACGLDDGSIVVYDIQLGNIRLRRPYNDENYDIPENIPSHISKRVERIRSRSCTPFADHRNTLRSESSLSTVYYSNYYGKEYVESLLYLKEKPNLLISTRGNGMISFWDVNTMNEYYTFLGNPNYESVTCVCTSSTNDTIIFGDLEGYVRVYDISRICANPKRITENDVKLIKRFRAHAKGIVSIAYVELYNMVITASEDCTSMLYDLKGVRIGYFGQKKKWEIGNEETYGYHNITDLKEHSSIDDQLLDSRDDEEEDEKEEEIKELDSTKNENEPKKRMSLSSLVKGLKEQSRLERVNTLEKLISDSLRSSINEKSQQMMKEFGSSPNFEDVKLNRDPRQLRFEKKMEITKIDETWTDRVSHFLDLHEMLPIHDIRKYLTNTTIDERLRSSLYARDFMISNTSKK